MSCLFQLPPFSGQFVKLLLHVECTLDNHGFRVRELLLTALFVQFCTSLLSGNKLD